MPPNTVPKGENWGVPVFCLEENWGIYKYGDIFHVFRSIGLLLVWFYIGAKYDKFSSVKQNISCITPQNMFYPSCLSIFVSSHFLTCPWKFRTVQKFNVRSKMRISAVSQITKYFNNFSFLLSQHFLHSELCLFFWVFVETCIPMDWLVLSQWNLVSFKIWWNCVWIETDWRGQYLVVPRRVFHKVIAGMYYEYLFMCTTQILDSFVGFCGGLIVLWSILAPVTGSRNKSWFRCILFVINIFLGNL